MIRSYLKLKNFDTYEERFEYLKLDGKVGSSTFGFDRWINQQFYTSYEWRNARDTVILRDNGCDLGISGYEIHTNILVHHMNPISVNDIVHGEEWIFDPNFLITCTKSTHNDLHFGVKRSYPKIVTSRTPNDTKLW